MNIHEHEYFDNHEQVVFCYDKISGLQAIIAIHDTRLGPAVGGCRMLPYASEQEALGDVLRLSRGMTYKSAISGLNFGGGKSVIIGDPQKLTTEALFRTFGLFVDGLNGRYITAGDVNTNLRCMEWIRIETKHVVGLPTHIGGLGDPSFCTSHGVFLGIKASLKKMTGKDSLANVKVAVQGMGHVGHKLCKELSEEGAKVYGTDVKKEALKNAVDKFNITAVEPDEIYGLDVDVFAPCALGAVINDKTIPQLKASIVAGGANNPLLDEAKHGQELAKRGILYAPDYVVNAGGLIDVSAEYFHAGKSAGWAKTEEIYDTTLRIFHLAEAEKVTPLQAADKLAEDRIHTIKQCDNIYTRRGKSRR